MREGKAVVIASLICVASAALLVAEAKGDDGEVTTQLQNGFTATHEANAAAPFEPVLYAPNRAFALGFLRVGAASLDLAVVHLPSSFPLWRATPARMGDWSRAATLTFDAGLVLTADDGPEHGVGVLWRTLNTVGDTVALLNSSNLVVRRYDGEDGPTWQSFDHPSDTLVLGQNFTASSPPLISANHRFALRLGRTYMALTVEFYGGGRATTPTYWQHTALEAEAQAPENATQPAQVYGRLDARGFFGLYLAAGGKEERVDVLSFDTFAQNVTTGGGALFRRMTLDDDGNLRAYYWTDESKAWTPEYKAISERCELPTSCGAYGLCVPGEAQCQCLANTTTSTAATTTSPPCGAEETADLCSSDDVGDFDVVRRTRVSVAYKEELPFATNKTAAECEAACAGNCSCWGALFNGASGYCYLLDFPVETMLYDADDRKVGYFKVRKPPSPSTTRRVMSPGVKAATAVVSIVLASLVAAGAYTGYRMWVRKKRRREGMEQELAPGRPYKDLKSMGSSNNNSFKS
ncbi:hypothetical protein EJB05_29493, partial [Eragrostis curvula]